MTTLKIGELTCTAVLRNWPKKVLQTSPLGLLGTAPNLEV
jgi:hypothetical protein